MPTTHEQPDFAHGKFLVFCSLQPTKSACSAAAAWWRKRYNTLDFPAENRVPIGMLLTPIGNPEPRDCTPLDTTVFVTCVYTNLPRLVYCTLSENTKIPQTSSYNWDEICGIFYRTHNTYIVGRADSYVKITPQQLPV